MTDRWCLFCAVHNPGGFPSVYFRACEFVCNLILPTCLKYKAETNVLKTTLSWPCCIAPSISDIMFGLHHYRHPTDLLPWFTQFQHWKTAILLLFIAWSIMSLMAFIDTFSMCLLVTLPSKTARQVKNKTMMDGKVRKRRRASRRKAG